MLLHAASATGITNGQLDDFNSDSTLGWGSGPINPTPPSVAFDVGPDGAGDDALLIMSAGGFGGGSKPTAFNQSQWTGDYTVEGIESIILDVNNVGPNEVNLRVGIDGDGGLFVSTIAIPIAPGSGWRTVEIPILPGDLTSDGGFDVLSTLGNVTQLRFTSAEGPTFRGDPIEAELLLDNIEAVPEPGTVTMLAIGVLAFSARASRRHR